MWFFYADINTDTLYLLRLINLKKKRGYRFDGALRRKRKLFWGLERGHLGSNTKRSLVRIDRTAFSTGWQSGQRTALFRSDSTDIRNWYNVSLFSTRQSVLSRVVFIEASLTSHIFISYKTYVNKRWILYKITKDVFKSSLVVLFRVYLNEHGSHALTIPDLATWFVVTSLTRHIFAYSSHSSGRGNALGYWENIPGTRQTIKHTESGT